MINFYKLLKSFLSICFAKLTIIFNPNLRFNLKKLVELAADIDEKEHPKPAFLMVITTQNVAIQDENGVYRVPLGCLKP